MTESDAPPSANENGKPDLRLRLIVFFSGACLMALEMAGVRILEPHFGSTIYVWGSVIGIFLGALSLGYWLGGMLSDKHPRLPVLGCVIFIAALFILVIPWIAGPVCGALENAPTRFRPLLGGLALYCIPSILIGIVSPFAVRLAARDVSNMGRVAGGLYALSTLGSIIGTFLVTFVLVEYIGNKAIVLSVAGSLLGVSGLCFVGQWGGKSVAAMGVGLLALAGSFYQVKDPVWRMDIRLRYTAENIQDSVVKYPDTLKDSAESTYHHITIIDSHGENYLDEYRRPARLMKFNNQTESGIMLNEKGELLDGKIQTACGYTRLLHLGVIFTEKAPRRVLIIGCGGGIGPQAFREDYAGTIERIDVVDIDHMVFDYARKYFFFPEAGTDSIIKAHVMDGREFVKRASENKKWDYIIMDAYTSGGRIPKHLISKEFFAEAKKKLAPGGIVLANVISALGTDIGTAKGESSGASRLYKSTFKTMQAVFGEGKIYTFPRRRRGKEAENIILVAAPDSPTLLKADIKSRYLALAGKVIKQQRFGYDGLDSIIDNAKSVAPRLEGIPILTDDFCPTDSMVAE